MPKQIFQINKFHGGLNNNSDPKDLSVGEVSEASDVMVDHIGRVRGMGDGVPYNSNLVDLQSINENPGYGLFSYSHDRKIPSIKMTLDDAELINVGDFIGNGEDFTLANEQLTPLVSVGVVYSKEEGDIITVSKHITGEENPWTADSNVYKGSSMYAQTAEYKTNIIDGAPYDVPSPETGEDYILLADAANSSLSIYDKTANYWRKDIIDLGDSDALNPLKAAFYNVDGALRISDGNFGSENTNKWYGYIDRYQFGDGSTHGVNDTGWKYSQWFSGDASLTSLPLQSVGTTLEPTILAPVALWFLFGTTGHTTPYYTDCTSGGETHGGSWVKENDKFIKAVFTAATDETLTLAEQDDYTNHYLENFCDVGDWISIGNSSANTGTWLVTAFDDNHSAQEITVDGDLDAVSDEIMYLTNLSRCEWWNDVNQYLEFGMTTIYDGNQESAINIHSEKLAFAISPSMISDYHSPEIGARVFTGASNTFGSTYPRVTGFNIYVRRSTSSGGTGDFYKLLEIDIKEGQRISQITDTWNRWLSILNGDDAVIFTGDGGAAGLSEWGQDLSTGGKNPFPYTDTYQMNSHISDIDTSVIVEGFKTAVVVNRTVFLGNIKQNGIIYGDRMIKSTVNQFDKFPDNRIIEAAVNDGDEIVKLEEFADRILQFKKNKMHLINVSQEIEFLEETFAYKGVSHPAATCKTDFGIAWVNHHGVYLYDGSKVINLFEKAGVSRISKESWNGVNGFTTGRNPMIGYIPDKRQLMIIRNAGREFSDNDIFMYDMVTQSWTQGKNKLYHPATYFGLALSSTTYNEDNEVITDSGGQVDGAGTYVANQIVRIDATTDPQVQFLGWFEDDVLVEDGIESTGNSKIYYFRIQSERHLEARFKIYSEFYTLRRASNDDGSLKVNVNPPLSFYYNGRWTADPTIYTASDGFETVFTADQPAKGRALYNANGIEDYQTYYIDVNDWGSGSGSVAPSEAGHESETPTTGANAKYHNQLPTNKWSVSPAYEYVDYIDGTPPIEVKRSYKLSMLMRGDPTLNTDFGGGYGSSLETAVQYYDHGREEWSNVYGVGWNMQGAEDQHGISAFTI